MQNNYNGYNYNPFPQQYNQDENFTGKYVDSYQEVLNTPVATNGKATIFVLMKENIMWSKKIENGIPVIQPYSIHPYFQQQEIKEEIKEPPVDPFVEIKSNFAELFSQLNSMKEEISILKGDKQ